MSTIALIPSVGQVALEAGLGVDRTELPWPQRAKALTIVDPTTNQLAADERAGVKALIDEAHKRHDPVVAAAYRTHQLAVEERRKDLAPLEEAVKIYDRAMLGWSQEQARIAREVQRQIEQAATQKQLEEREAEIEHAEATGASPVEVKAIAEAPLPAPVVMARPVLPPKAAGVVMKEAWKGEITDLWAFVQFAVQNNRRELIGLIAQDRPAVNSFARSIKGAAAIPGLRIWDDGQVASSPGKVAK